MQHARERVHVGTVGDVVVGEPFRRHVRVGPDRGAQLGQLLVGDGVGDAEVDQVGEVLTVEDDVLRLDVAVCDPGFVGGVERRGDLLHDSDRSRGCHRPIALQHLAQVVAFDHAHVDEEKPVDLAVVVDRHHVRLLQPARGMGLALESLAEHRIARRRLRQQFQRDDAVLDRVLGLVYLTHAALAQQPSQPIRADLGTNA